MEAKVAIKYVDLNSFALATAMQKIKNTPTLAAKASQIRKVVKKYDEATALTKEKYKTDLGDVYHDKNADGTPKMVETAEGKEFALKEGTQEEYKKVVDEFGKRTYEFNLSEFTPLNPTILSDVKLTAADIEALGPLFSEEAGPGLPPQPMK